MAELNALTAHEIHDLMQEGQVRCSDVVESVFNRIDAVEGDVHAYLHLTRDMAFQQAEQVDKTIRAGKSLRPLAGIPIAVKDNICIRNLKTSCASRILEDFVSPYDATVVERLRAENVVFVGKTNLDEFAMGSSCENSSFGTTHNPWDLSRIPGGSSGGSAAAVAADETILALGSDTGGSIRQPASFCGIVGVKPTYGRVSRYGLVAFASSLDQIGPVTKDVRDAALLMNVICSHDPRDSTSAPVPGGDFTDSLGQDLKGITLGIPDEFFGEGLDAQVERSIREAVALLEGCGAQARTVSLPHSDYAVAAYYIVATAEASSNLARYDGVKYGLRSAASTDLLEMYEETKREGFGPEVKRRIMLGTYALSSGYYEAYYLKAQKVRTLIKEDFTKAFERCDAILSPVSPTPAFRIGEKMDDPLQMYLSDIYTLSANLAGIPAISVPCGFSEDGLPIGLHITGKAFDEGTILRIAHALERNTEYHRRKPEIGPRGSHAPLQ